jgi:chemotaxis protein MotB
MSAGRGENRLRKKGGDEQLEGAGMMRWLLTYADMITLLLALFIILFSVSTIDKVKLQRLVNDMAGGFNGTGTQTTRTTATKTGSGSTGDKQLQQIEQKIRAYIAKNHLEDKVQTRIDRRGLVITLLTDKALFDSGSAQLRPETQRILDNVDTALRLTTNDIRVEGYTDDVPISTPQFATNWELSAARATGVTRYLVERDGLSPLRTSFGGYGQFRPAHPNDTEAHRQLNRRVDIVVLNMVTTRAQHERGGS